MALPSFAIYAAPVEVSVRVRHRDRRRGPDALLGREERRRAAVRDHSWCSFFDQRVGLAARS